METAGNIRIHIRDPSGLEPIEFQSHPILPALSTNVLPRKLKSLVAEKAMSST